MRGFAIFVIEGNIIYVFIIRLDVTKILSQKRNILTSLHKKEHTKRKAKNNALEATANLLVI